MTSPRFAGSCVARIGQAHAAHALEGLGDLRDHGLVVELERDEDPAARRARATRPT